MTDVTQILSQIEDGDPSAAEQLLPLVYQDLKRLAEQELRREPSGNTLQPTALVHEAWLRLVDQHSEPRWSHRGHFYAAAAEAFDADRIVDSIITAVNKSRLAGGIERAANV